MSGGFLESEDKIEKKTADLSKRFDKFIGTAKIAGLSGLGGAIVGSSFGAGVNKLGLTDNSLGRDMAIGAGFGAAAGLTHAFKYPIALGLMKVGGKMGSLKRSIFNNPINS